MDNSAGDAPSDGVGRSSPGVNLHDGAAADRSRAGRAASQTHIHSQNDLLNCQLMTSSLPGLSAFSFYSQLFTVQFLDEDEDEDEDEE